MLEAGFIFLTIAVAVCLLVGVSIISERAIPDVIKRKSFRVKAVIFLVGWLSYVAILSLNGVFEHEALPPRIPLLLVFPAFAFIIFFFASGRFRSIIQHTPASWPVRFQVFRIAVELLLLRSFLEHRLPVEATFEGYNFDVVIGILAPVVGWLFFRNGTHLKWPVRLFNIAGFITLSIVVFVVISQAYFPAIWHKQSILNLGIGQFPFTYLAGFLMPVAVFMHIFSLVKTRFN